MIPETLRTIGDIIAVIPDPLIERTASGIWLGDEDRNQSEVGIFNGTVLCVGPKCEVLKKGDRVMFHRSLCADWDFSLPGQPAEIVKFFHEHECMALLEESN
jgi:co-chaperonin GroES (HSP10)